MKIGEYRDKIIEFVSKTNDQGILKAIYSLIYFYKNRKS